jgi:hypothetical protein
MARSREKVKDPGPDEYKIARDRIFRYIHSYKLPCKLGSAIRHKGKYYEAFVVIKEREDT